MQYLSTFVLRIWSLNFSNSDFRRLVEGERYTASCCCWEKGLFATLGTAICQVDVNYARSRSCTTRISVYILLVTTIYFPPSLTFILRNA